VCVGVYKYDPPPSRTQVLTTLSQTFTIFEPSDTLVRDMLIVFGIGATYKILFALLFLVKTRGGSPPVPVAAAMPE
jgi:hypothetical protein